MATPFMNLNLPTPTVTLGPAWATELNEAIETVDSHDHSSGKGTTIKTAGLSIDADLEMNTFALLNLSKSGYVDHTVVQDGAANLRNVYAVNGDLYFTNNSGTAVQITDGGTVVTSPANTTTFEIAQLAADLIIAPASTFVVLLVDTSVARSITLPLAGSVTAGRIYMIKDNTGQSNGNPISLVAAGSDTIDGNASETLDSNLGTTTVIGDGVDKWSIL